MQLKQEEVLKAFQVGKAAAAPSVAAPLLPFISILHPAQPHLTSACKIQVLNTTSGVGNHHRVKSVVNSFCDCLHQQVEEAGHQMCPRLSKRPMPSTARHLLARDQDLSM